MKRLVKSIQIYLKRRVLVGAAIYITWDGQQYEVQTV